MTTRRTKRAIESVEEFDPLKNYIPLPTSLPILKTELDAIPSAIVLDLFADYWPPAPSSKANWDIERQMNAAGFSMDLIKMHCVKAALSWGL